VSAAILRFPTPANAPVVQLGRKRRLPAGVKSIEAYRLERQQQDEKARAENIEQVKTMYVDIFARAIRGELTGIAVVEARGPDRQDVVIVAGEFEEDFGYLQRSLDKFASMVPRWAMEKQS
jgi:hypothetical protein